MKIIKTAQEVNDFRAQRELANIGCKTCPCCGENMSFMEAIKKNDLSRRGIYSITLSRPVKSNEYKNIDVYLCARCGAEWESDPY